ncbi:hypothetical protein [Tenacibaculum geojense]|uniref:Uncharacterized protein n=1 Tax=Tenacibaculum geojense TaxID=915352 RepID=A0ABW3JRU0_9FLAO
MTNKFAVLVNLYVVPLTAVLLSYNGFIRGGTGNIIVDALIYFISFFLSYSIVYFFSNFYKNKGEKYLSVILYLLIIALYTFKINTLLLIPLVIVFTHLLFKTQQSDEEIDLDKSILSFIIKSLPNKNRIALGLYFFIATLIILFL